MQSSVILDSTRGYGRELRKIEIPFQSMRIIGDCAHVNGVISLEIEKLEN
jgi:hypothetical protein